MNRLYLRTYYLLSVLLGSKGVDLKCETKTDAGTDLSLEYPQLTRIKRGHDFSLNESEDKDEDDDDDEKYNDDNPKHKHKSKPKHYKSEDDDVKNGSKEPGCRKRRKAKKTPCKNSPLKTRNLMVCLKRPTPNLEVGPGRKHFNPLANQRILYVSKRWPQRYILRETLRKKNKKKLQEYLTKHPYEIAIPTAIKPPRRPLIPPPRNPVLPPPNLLFHLDNSFKKELSFGMPPGFFQNEKDTKQRKTYDHRFETIFHALPFLQKYEKPRGNNRKAEYSEEFGDTNI